MALSLETTKQANSVAATLADRIVSRQAAVAVIGLGYVGLPLAIECARTRFTVIGFDTDASKVAQVSAGKSYIRDVPSDVLGPLVSKGQIRATRENTALGDAVRVRPRGRPG